MHGHRLCKVIQQKRLALHRDIAVLIRSGPPQQGHRRGRRVIEQDLFTADSHQFDHRFGTDVIDRAAAVPGVDKGL